MSKINKIICDICGREINIKKDKAFALFKSVRIQQTMNDLLLNNMQQNNNLKVDNQYNEINYDICSNCMIQIEENIINSKNEKYINLKK